MVKLKAAVVGNQVTMDKDSLEHIMICLANQKFINEYPPNGDAHSIGKEKYKSIQEENQEVIDNCYRQIEELVCKRN